MGTRSEGDRSPRGLPTGLHSLFRNNGDGTFTDVSEASGVAKIKGRYGLTPVAADFDEANESVPAAVAEPFS